MLHIMHCKSEKRSKYKTNSIVKYPLQVNEQKYQKIKVLDVTRKNLQFIKFNYNEMKIIKIEVISVLKISILQIE